jgi:hypothetical protein
VPRAIVVRPSGPAISTRWALRLSEPHRLAVPVIAAETIAIFETAC